MRVWFRVQNHGLGQKVESLGLGDLMGFSHSMFFCWESGDQRHHADVSKHKHRRYELLGRELHQSMYFERLL